MGNSRNARSPDWQTAPTPAPTSATNLRLLRIGLTSALVVTLLTLLTLLAGGEGIADVLSIFASSLALAIILRLWQRFIYSRVFPDTHSGWPSSPA